MEEIFLDNRSVAEILRCYYDKCPYTDEHVNKLQNCYDKCTEVLDSISMQEINLLWQLRHIPKRNQKLIFDFTQNNYELWKSKACLPIDIVRFGKEYFQIDKVVPENK